MKIKILSRHLPFAWIIALSVMMTPAIRPLHAAVKFERLPDSGIQPQIVTAPDAVTHLIYLTGEPAAADVQYRYRSADSTDWSSPIRVNSQPGSAVAMGTIRGAQLALGRNGIIHVAWNGSRVAQDDSTPGSAPLLYAHLEKDGKRFTPQRNLMTATHHLDGGGSIAADSEGRVFAVWHASPLGAQGEKTRAVYLAFSADDGKTFSPERPISPNGTGACGCCGLSAFVNPAGDAFVLYRVARTALQRDMMLLASTDRSKTFTEVLSDPWNVGACPMSSASFTANSRATWATWETAGQIHAARLRNPDEGHAEILTPESPKGAKHPRAIVNDRGETLLVWTLGTGWQRGGSLAWQLFDPAGKPTSARGERDGIPVWSFAAGLARSNGDFVIVY